MADKINNGVDTKCEAEITSVVIVSVSDTKDKKINLNESTIFYNKLCGFFARSSTTKFLL